jgi:enoyl-CoA hydratase
MVNKVVPREELRETVTAGPPSWPAQPRLGNWLTKQAVNHVEELRGKRAAMDAVFHMHHFAHAQNDLVYGNSIAGVSANRLRRRTRSRPARG